MHNPSGYIGKHYEQNICTPPFVVEPLYPMLGGSFDLDAFCGRATRGSIIRAKRRVNFPREDGLILPWWGSVWGNPPFRRLGEALEKAWRSVCRGGDAYEAFIHGPLRTHRRYWKFAWRAQSICYLDRIRYLGWEDDFPFPTVVLYYGPRAGTFMRAMAHLGVVAPLTPWHARFTLGEEMSLHTEYENRLRAVLIDTVRCYPRLSLIQIKEQLSLEEDDWERLLQTPIGDFGAPEPEEATAATTATAKPNGKNGHKGKKKAPPKPVSKPSTDIEAHVSGMKKGAQFKTSELMEEYGLGRNTVLRRLEPMVTAGKIAQYGQARGAYWQVEK